jgi:hypothetical protein
MRRVCYSNMTQDYSMRMERKPIEFYEFRGGSLCKSCGEGKLVVDDRSSGKKKPPSKKVKLAFSHVRRTCKTCAIRFVVDTTKH